MARLVASTLCLLAIVSVLAACTSSTGDGGAEPIPLLPGEELGTRNFLQFLNRQPALAAGDYQLVAATQAAGEAGDYRIELRFDDGTEQTIEGRWTDSGGPDPQAEGNPRHGFTLERPGGVQAKLESQIDGQLLLLDRSGNLLSTRALGPRASSTQIALPESRTDDDAYAAAYYATIDPLNQRTRLADWKRINGFETGEDAAVVFRDTKDLGYGRDMHLRRNALGGIAIFVDNYQLVGIDPLEYSSLNLDAAIERNPRFYLGTNALEFGLVDADGDGEADDVTGDGMVNAQDSFVRFYAFSPQPPFERILRLDMDGLGDKAMPIPCITCHGGRAEPLQPDGKFRDHGDVHGRLQPIDVDEMEFSTQAGFTRADFEAGLKALNRAVYDSWEPRLVPRKGEWNSARARELIEAWYGGPGLPSTVFQDSYVPDSWHPNPDTGSPPAGSDTFYREVFAANCRGCHLLRGTQDLVVSGQPGLDNSALDFASFDKFIGHREQILQQVFDTGQMPLALVPFRTLFATEGLPEGLAQIIPDFDRRDAQGKLLRPGRAIANAGPDRTSPSPVALSGIASRQALDFSWRIVGTPEGATASLQAADRVRTVLSADTDGIYELELSVRGAAGETSVDRVQVRLASNLPLPPAQITFADHIKPLLQSPPGVCSRCHTAQSPSFLPALLLDDPAPGEARDLYTDVRSRINFNNPEESPLLTEATGRRHTGMTRMGFDLATGDRAGYDLVLEWILEGARER